MSHDEQDFVDTRFYVRTVSRLEHAFASTSRVVRDALLDKVEYEEAAKVLESMVSTLQAAAGDAPQWPILEQGQEVTKLLAPLQSTCLSACTAVHRYLLELSHAWTSYVERVRDRVREAVRASEAKVRETQQLVANCRAPNSAVALGEYRKELVRIRASLETALSEASESDEPSQGSARIGDAIAPVTEVLVGLHGRASTKHVLQYKDALESEICRIESEVGVAFVEAVSRALVSMQVSKTPSARTR